MSFEQRRHSLSCAIVEPAARLAGVLMNVATTQGAETVDDEFFGAAFNVARTAHRVSLRPLGPDPKVSCVMVSRNHLDLVRPSIHCYLAQTYANRELVIVRDPSVPIGEVETYVAGLHREDIKLVRPEGSLRLNALRNLSFAHASGELLCQWDDDDLSHPDRVEIQVDVLREHDVIACFLQDEFEYFVSSGELYWASWEGTPLSCLPGSLMLRSDAGATYPLQAALSEKSEDGAIMFSLAQPVAIVQGAPYLYVYSFHSNNTWGESHRRDLAEHLRVSVEGRHEEFVRELARVGLSVVPRVGLNGIDLRVARRGGPG
jgi:glycosyltransferase involved in cell wall biosynthesis